MHWLSAHGWAVAKHWKQRMWDFGFPLVARLARSRWHRASLGLGRGLGLLTLGIQRGQPKSGLEAVGLEWQRMFPNAKMVPITGSDETTVYAEIRTHCPLRGTGDTEACHRMMEYDRRMLERIGGQLVVLHSQSEPGRQHCEVAIREVDVSLADLVPAHLRRPSA